MSQIPNPYDVLGVSEQATPEKIKKEYRRLSKQYHPDPNNGTGDRTKFEEVAAAHDILSDPEKKKTYDDEAAEQKAEQVRKEKERKEREARAAKMDFSAFGGPPPKPKAQPKVTPNPQSQPPRQPPRTTPPPRPQPNPFSSTVPLTSTPASSSPGGMSGLSRWLSFRAPGLVVAVLAVIGIVALAASNGHSSGCRGPNTHNAATECPGAYNCGWYTLGNHVVESPVANVVEPVRLMKVEEVPIYYYGEDDIKTTAHNVWMLTGKYDKTDTSWCRVVTASTRKTSKAIPNIHGYKGMIQVLEQLPGCKLNLFYSVLDGSIVNYQTVAVSCKETTLEHEGFDPRPLYYGSGGYNPLTAESEIT